MTVYRVPWRPRQQGMGEQIKKEIAVMKMVKQRHVVNLLEVLASRTKIFIVLELVTGGESNHLTLALALALVTGV